MIEITLHDKTGDIIPVESHPEYVDFEVRDSRTRTSQARLGLADENFVAPIVAGLNRKTAIETYPDLMRAVTDIAAKHSTREDGRRVLELLAAWGRPHPQARWHVTGAENVPRVRYIEVATMPRLSATSLTADPIARGVRFIGEAERMDDVDLDELDKILDFGNDYDEISGAMLLQREVRIRPTGGGTRAKNKRKKSGGDGGSSYGGGIDDDASERREVFGVRISPVAKTALQESGVGRELIEALGLAIASGRTIEGIHADLKKAPSRSQT